ncbi:MAG: sigma-70 family RNA polymerase sigma factor [Lachnospiraceae bacterium]|nr:sigma-70 family RNA polymerase sigma factor [Lachnospiraceae bacterium]
MNNMLNYSGIVPIVFLAIENDTDREAITELYLSYRNLFIKVARKFFGNNDVEVEDAVAATAERLCKYYENFLRVPCKKMPLYMVYTISNVCRNRMQKLREEKVMCYEVDIEDAINQIPDSHGGIGVLFDRSNALVLLDSFESLSSREKELIRMRHIDRYSIEEIADQLNLKPNAVYTALSRAKAHLEQAASLSAKE